MHTLLYYRIARLTLRVWGLFLLVTALMIGSLVFTANSLVVSAQTDPITPQVTQTLIDRWFNTEAGMLGMSLTLNIALLFVSWYLLKLLLKRESEKTTILENNMKEVKMIYDQVLESTLDVTKAITELSTIIKRGKE